MRVCIFGAGAIGGYLGAELAASDVDVTLIARGPHLEAMQRDGLKLLIGGEQRIIHPTCTSDPTEAGPQDYVIITLKAHSVPGIVETIQPLIGPDTTVVTAVNGIPWWYFHGLEGRVAGPSPGEHRPGRRSVGPHRPRTGAWLHRLPGLRHAGPRRHPACGGQPLQPGRA